MFHVNLFEPAAINPSYAGYIQPSLLLIKVDNEAKWKMTAIINSCYFNFAKKFQH